MLKAETCFARSVLPSPRERAIRLEPPMPNRFAIPVSRMNSGMHRDTAATWFGSPTWPIKNVSAMLYATVISWLMTVGTTREITALETG